MPLDKMPLLTDYLVMPENFCAKFCMLLQQGAVY